MISQELANTTVQMNGEAGSEWLSCLPALVAQLSHEWGFQLSEMFASNYAFVAAGSLTDGSSAVLKIGMPKGEYLVEMRAMVEFSGDGSVRVIRSDSARGALIMERISPGTTLAAAYPEEDDRATEIAADVMKALWRPAAAGFPTVSDWGRAFQRVGPGPLPLAVFEKVERVFAELSSSMQAPVLLHGDFHHMNILLDDRHSWVAIDPKGVVGEPAYEVGAFMRNQPPRDPSLLFRRLDIFSERLGIDRQRLLGWSFAQCVLSALWSIEDGGDWWQGTIAVAEVLGRAV